MNDLTPIAAQQERPIEHSFAAQDVLFSRTDERGVILAGNTAFRQLAGYEWDALIGAPHKIIRHPDMPKAVFHIMWDRLKAKQAIGAYVKNRTVDGGFYWVFAIATPTKGGYMSVRIRPLAGRIPDVSTLYASVRKAENDEGLSAADGAERLLRGLADLGYENYDAFMAHSMSCEIGALNAALGSASDRAKTQFDSLRDTVKSIQTETNDLLGAFDAVRGIPFNMRILASRLEAAGGPISVISANYGEMSGSIGEWLKRFTTDSSSAFAAMQSAVNRAFLLHATAGIQAHVYHQLEREPEVGPSGDCEIERGHLLGQSERFRREAGEAVKEIEQRADRFSIAVRDMKRLITGLSSTRMMCKIESARLKRGGEALLGIIDQLDEFQETIERRLDQIDSLNRTVQKLADDLKPKSEVTASA